MALRNPEDYGLPSLVHSCCGTSDVAYDPARVRSLMDRLRRMVEDLGTPTAIAWSPDIDHQRVSGRGPYVHQIEGLHAVRTRCEPSLPPNSIVFEGRGSTTEAPPRSA